MQINERHDINIDSIRFVRYDSSEFCEMLTNELIA